MHKEKTNANENYEFVITIWIGWDPLRYSDQLNEWFKVPIAEQWALKFCLLFAFGG